MYIDIADDLAEVEKGGSFGTIEAVKTVADLFSPVGGKVVEVNRGLNDAPETVNKDPYGEGWIIKVELSNPADLDELMDVNAYKELVGH